MHQRTVPHLVRTAAALRALARLAAVPGAVQPGRDMFVPHPVAPSVNLVVSVVTIGAEQDAHAAIVAAMTDAHEVDHGATRSTWGRILGVWYRVIGPDWFARTGPAPAPAAVPVAAHYQTAGWVGGPGECGVKCVCGIEFDNFDTIAEAAELLDGHIEHQAEQSPRPRQAGPLTPEKVRELVARGLLTPDLRLAENGVPLQPTPRPFLVAIEATTTTVRSIRTEHTG